MKIYFEKTNGNNKVIFTDGKTAKVLTEHRPEELMA